MNSPAVIDLVAGARPNFMKLAPVVRALSGRSDLRYRIVHTARLWKAGERPKLVQQVIEGDPGLGA